MTFMLVKFTLSQSRNCRSSDTEPYKIFFVCILRVAPTCFTKSKPMIPSNVVRESNINKEER